MARKRFLPPIDIHRANFVLFGVILLLLIVFHQQLVMASYRFPLFLRGKIMDPGEKVLCRRAASIIREGKEITRALPLLERAIAIDPCGEALFWLGEYYYLSGDPGRALPLFERYLAIDETFSAASSRCAQIYESLGETGKARRALNGGISSLEAALRDKPVYDSAAAEVCNNKTLSIFCIRTASLRQLKEQLSRLEREHPGRP